MWERLREIPDYIERECAAHGTSPGSSIDRLEELRYSSEWLTSLKKHSFKPLLPNRKMGLNQLSLVLKAMCEERPMSTSLTPPTLSSNSSIITLSSSSSISPSSSTMSVDAAATPPSAELGLGPAFTFTEKKRAAPKAPRPRPTQLQKTM
jgi:hypothetical protein